MENYLQDLFEKDDIGFKTINSFKADTKQLVLILNNLIEKRAGKNITLVEMNKLIDSLNLDNKLKNKMKLLTKKEPKDNKKKNDNNQVGGWSDSINIDSSYIRTVDNINNLPCGGSVTQCGDFISSCGQAGGGSKKNPEDLENHNHLMFETTLNTTRLFEISDKNKDVLYKIIKIYISR
tara:strand:+ start:11 stop:547 length:537 start_codon:yes stop_codon:yes gene_type:complete